MFSMIRLIIVVVHGAEGEEGNTCGSTDRLLVTRNHILIGMTEQRLSVVLRS